MAVFTQAQYDALVEAISTGVRQVKYETKSVVYDSLDEMLNLARRMERALGISPGVDGATAKLRHTRVWAQKDS